MSVVTERYTALVCPADTATPITGNSVGHFVCTTAGTITLTSTQYGVLVNGLAVVAGGIYPLMFNLGNRGGTLTTAGGAVGCLGV